MYMQYVIFGKVNHTHIYKSTLLFCIYMLEFAVHFPYIKVIETSHVFVLMKLISRDTRKNT